MNDDYEHVAPITPAVQQEISTLFMGWPSPRGNRRWDFSFAEIYKDHDSYFVGPVFISCGDAVVEGVVRLTSEKYAKEIVALAKAESALHKQDLPGPLASFSERVREVARKRFKELTKGGKSAPSNSIDSNVIFISGTRGRSTNT